MNVIRMVAYSYETAERAEPESGTATISFYRAKHPPAVPLRKTAGAKNA
jgi:hypothetical protein